MTDAEYTLLSPEDVRFRLDYNPETGELFWKNSKMPKRNGTLAGGIQKIGYHVTSIDKVHYLSHRLAWCHYYGEWPNLLVDHINGIKTDNRISNLRLATKQQNNFNSVMWKSNTSGHKGVYWSKKRQKWHVQATINYKTKYLGAFDNLEDASETYKKYAEQNHGLFYNPDSLRNRHEHDRPKISAANV